MTYTNIRLENYFIEWFALQNKKKQAMKKKQTKNLGI